MSELTKQALRVDNNQSFPNNNAGLITPTALRGFNENMIDSTVNQQVYTADSASFNQRINEATASLATVPWDNVTSKPTNLVSASSDTTNVDFSITNGTISANLRGGVVSGSQQISGLGFVSSSITGSSLVTASFAAQTLTFTKGDGSQFGVFIPDNSGSVLPSGVVSGSSQINYPQISNIPAGIVSGSSQLTSSYDLRYVLSGSVQPLPSGTISGSSQITALGFVSSSITGSSVITASFSGNTLTFTKGDNSTFGVVIPDVSGSTINTGSFATTGSNNFIGNQTITGSLFLSSSVSASIIVPNTFGTEGLVVDGNMRVQNGTLIVPQAINAGGIYLQTIGRNSNDPINVDNGLNIRPGAPGIVATNVSISGSVIVSQSLELGGTLTSSLQQGFVLVGNASGRTQAIPTSSLGGGGTGNGFPFSGSAVITGSLSVSQTIKSQVYMLSLIHI